MKSDQMGLLPMGICDGFGKCKAAVNGEWYYTDKAYVSLCKTCQKRLAKRFLAFVKEVCGNKK